MQQNTYPRASCPLSALDQTRQAATRSHVSDKPSQEEMQGWWDNAMRNNMNFSHGYLEVAVLMIRWDSTIADTDSAKEVDDLKNILERKYHFAIEPTLELSNDVKGPKPQHQLGKGINDFISKYDGQQRLLIVYYTGHGRWVRPETEPEGHLLLSAYVVVAALSNKCANMHRCSAQNSGLETDQGHSAVADWNTAEKSLTTQYVDANVCVILDCCYAANIVHKSSSNDSIVRSYQLLAPSGPDMLTSSNPSWSFTTALIASLEELCNEYGERCFTLDRLCERINLKPYRRNEQSQVWNRLPVVGQPIRLAPLSRDLSQEVSRKPVQGYLTLRFAVEHRTFNKPRLDSLARHLSKCCEFNSMVRRIDLIGFEKAPDAMRSMMLVWHYCRRWRRRCSAKHLRPRTGEPPLTPGLTPESAADALYPSTTRKRARSPSESPRLLATEPSKRRAALHVAHEMYAKSDLEAARAMTPPPA
ncbi:hypothetical protein LTR56_002388 [Elasticomyces elasticus]|nr:hypothetical protein LTR56_002388 [Elasticomyces elasticus]KAK3665952.1 hypothetical protein LTR22_003271 [Elasticomyces elasticus]KAK4929424.1 hypothetical protein LTR49_004028 [Elasticomyces elasticus]KAK5764713.1 hypothetical protein LTS12_005214 [Elasticomyces elasticus]